MQVSVQLVENDNSFKGSLRSRGLNQDGLLFLKKVFKCEKVLLVRSSSFTSLKTGYITAYRVMDTMEFVSASFFISSIVILQGGAARV